MSCRYPLEARGIGVVRHQRQKTYMMLVLWSDRNNVLIYRTFEEFKRFHRDLKRKFPIEAGHMKKSERSIPRLKDAQVFLRRNRDSRRFLLRLKLLESYAQALLRTDAKISQSEDVTRFFTPQTQDLEPSFHENSIVIMPSEAGDGRSNVSRPHASASVIQPITSEKYRCVEAYETKDTKNRPFKVHQGELLGVLLKDTTGWWLVENEEKRLAWFPAPYLFKLPKSTEVSQSGEALDTGMFYFAEKCYQAKDADELSVSVGVVVTVLEKSDHGWWLVWYNGEAGYVPSMFLQPYRNPHQKLQAITRHHLHASTPNLLEPASASLPRRVGFQEAPPPSSATEEGIGESGRPLQRKVSRSLSSLPTTTPRKRRSSLTLELGVLVENSGSGSAPKLYEEWRPSPLPRNVLQVLGAEHCPSAAVGQVDNLGQRTHKPVPRRRLSKDAGLGESFSTSGSDQSLGPSHSDSQSEVPKVPRKPEAHEIMERCTTVTKKALQRVLPSQGR